MGVGFSSSTYNGNPCLPPLENSLPCMAWVAWVDQSGTLCKCFIDSWHLDLRCHYLLNYPINCCMHILFQHYISTVIDEYTIHFDGSYWKYDEMVDQKEVNFSRGAHSTSPCGTLLRKAYEKMWYYVAELSCPLELSRVFKKQWLSLELNIRLPTIRYVFLCRVPWLSGYGIRLRILRSAVQLPIGPLDFRNYFFLYFILQ